MTGSTFPESLRADFEPLSVLGEGGMGVVFLARDRRLDREVAIKLVTGVVSRELRTRLAREGAWLSRIEHPHVLRLYDYGEAAGQPFLVTERLEGRSLDEAGGLEDPLGVMLAIAEALEACHQAGVVHRDVKPANILLTTDGRPVLLDFGLLQAPEQTCVTATGHVVGTPWFLAPECLRGGAVGPSADWWAWGVSLFFLCEGRPPYSFEDLLGWMAGGPRPALEYRRLQATDPRRRLIEACLREDPAQRPCSRAALEALGAAAGRRPRQPASSTRPAPAGAGAGTGARPWRWGVLAAAGAGLLGLAGLLGGRRVPPGDPAAPDPVAARLRFDEAMRAAGLRPQGANDFGHLEYRNERSGARMILIPGGSFRARGYLRRLEEPTTRTIQLPPFLIDAHEVSVRLYARYLEATGVSSPPRWRQQAEHPDFPVVQVSSHQARAYARWAGGRLPRPEEWERAAAGPENLEYPWGRAPPDASLANSGSADVLGLLDPTPHLMDVFTLPAGRSPCGAFHMAGNVGEWVETERPRVYAGGGFMAGDPNVRTDFLGRALFDQVVGIGFRTLRELPEAARGESPGATPARGSPPPR